MKMFNILVLFSLFLFPFSHGAVQDFCVGDLTLPQAPSGYACRDPATLTADDFVYKGLTVRANTSNIFKGNVILGNSDVYPGINGLDLQLSRLDLEVGGSIRLHSHPRASELLIVIEGSILTGFISATDVPYFKVLNKYEVIVFPQGLLHFQINAGKSSALAFVTLNSGSPGFQTTSFSLFANDFPTSYTELTTLISAAEGRRLKALLGGSG